MVLKQNFNYDFSAVIETSQELLPITDTRGSVHTNADKFQAWDKSHQLRSNAIDPEKQEKRSIQTYYNTFPVLKEDMAISLVRFISLKTI